MRVTPLAAIAVSLLLARSASSSFAGSDLSGSDPNWRAFEVCVAGEVKKLTDADLSMDGDIVERGLNVRKQVLSRCQAPEGMAGYRYEAYANAAVERREEAYARKEGEKQALEAKRQEELDAPIRAAKDEEERACLHAYFMCLSRHATVVANYSSEPADTVARAVFPSCLDERSTIADIYRRNGLALTDDSLEQIDKQFRDALLLIIIKARVQTAPSNNAPPRKEDGAT